MKTIGILIYFLLGTLFVDGQVSLRYEEGYSLNYEECIAAYSSIVKNFKKCELREIGTSDVGKPLYIFIAGDMSSRKPTILINNAIHPGEPCGVDASLIIAEQLLKEDSPILDRVNLAIIPMYNVGGALNRSCCTRANQIGPVEQGFRGNARNLDLNRDFLKADSKNAKVFQQIFQELKPSIFIDTHTSNGADYPYTMTLIHSQLNMIDEHLANVYGAGLVPEMYARMEEHYPMVPYMDMIGDTPEQGIMDFPDWPRYSTGYAALFNCFGFTTEAHMLKPYRDRVLATYHFIDELLAYSSEHADEILKNKMKADRNALQMKSMYLDFELDTTQKQYIPFKGFKAIYEPSKVTGLQRLRYDRNEMWEADILRLSHYEGRDEVAIPSHYIIPQAWTEIIEKLENNGVQMSRLSSDSLVEVAAYYVRDYETAKQPYEGHFRHSEIQTQMDSVEIQLFAGDYVIPTQQYAKRYIVNALEPRAQDSFFSWGFFNSVLQQKEWFSPYVFEEIAEEVLANDPSLNQQFQEKRKDPEFAANMWAQLIFVYRNSPYYELSHNRYPVYRSLD